MASILKTSFRIRNASDFMLQYAINPTENMYIAIGKETAWTDELFPDNPTDTVSQEESFWDNVIGLQKITATDIINVVPRKNWSSQEYFTFDKTSETAYDSDFYVINSLHEIYECTVKTNVNAATGEPTGHNNGAPISDGNYSWQYMYELNTYQKENLINDAWMPVTISPANNGSGSTNQDDYGDVDAVRTLGSRYIYIRSKIIESIDVPVDVTYRQVALICNPMMPDGITPLTAATASDTEVETYSGDLIYLENKRPIIRTTGQSEDFEVVLAF